MAVTRDAALEPKGADITRFRVGDVVVLRTDVSKEGLSSGQVGTVVLEFTEPCVAYETEFINADGETVAQLALSPEQLEAASTLRAAARSA